jgi:hypothetical protein
MATQNLSTPATEGNTPERKYRTRHGITTASQVGLDLLNRSAERLNFLQEVFYIVHHDGDGFTMPGYMTQGLAAILEDIKHDVWTAHNYHYGDDDTPGKIGDAPEVRS